MTPLVSVDFKNHQAEKNQNLIVLGKWNCHQARLSVAKFLQRIALTQASFIGACTKADKLKK
jgi:hypothetical protein